MRRSCSDFHCVKYGKTCTACNTTGQTKGALCMPTCDSCTKKNTCKLQHDLNK